MPAIVIRITSAYAAAGRATTLAIGRSHAALGMTAD
ncbi:hypothetical protein FHX15_000771 [Rhizobium sp. BK650]|nr:hypothetical protein [Rhizobium sp. BK650]